VGGDLRYVGGGHGAYQTETSYRYVGYGGEFSNVRRSRDFTILICASALLLLGLLSWLFWPTSSKIDCVIGRENWQYHWNADKQSFCCRTTGVGCPTIPQPAPLPGAVDPFNCASGYLNWKGGWSVSKKQWCCNVHGKGCPENGEGWEAQPAAEYDCNAGFENWVKGWSIPKKQWCCQKVGTGCIGSGAQNTAQAASQGFGAGAQYGDHGAPVAAITGIVPAAAGR